MKSFKVSRRSEGKLKELTFSRRKRIANILRSKQKSWPIVFLRFPFLFPAIFQALLLTSVYQRYLLPLSQFYLILIFFRAFFARFVVVLILFASFGSVCFTFWIWLCGRWRFSVCWFYLLFAFVSLRKRRKFVVEMRHSHTKWREGRAASAASASFFKPSLPSWKFVITNWNVD